MLGGEDEAIEACQLFNPIEFDGIKTGVVDLLPDAEELDGEVFAELVQAVLQTSQRGQIGGLNRPKAGVGSFQCSVFSLKPAARPQRERKLRRSMASRELGAWSRKHAVCHKAQATRAKGISHGLR